MRETPRKRGRRVVRRLRRAAALVAPFAAILLLFVAGDVADRARGYRHLRREPERPVLDTLLRLQAGLPRPGPEDPPAGGEVAVYDLRIGPKQILRLHDTAELVMSRGDTTGLVLPGYERAHFLRDGVWEPIRIKLRGWAANHYRRPFPSLRLQFPSNRPLRGMRQINLVDPYDKFITADVTTNHEAAEHGLLSWRSGFVVLRVNGEVWGEYLEIEQPGRELLEAHDRSEGPIFSVNGKVYGTADAGMEKGAALLERVRACVDARAPEPPCPWDLFRNGLDTERIAWAAAIMGLSGHWGAWLDDNVRLYFDPSRGTFEPIPWDYGYLRLQRELVHPADWPAQVPPDSVIGDGESAVRLGATLLALPEFRRMRDERLWLLATQRLEPMLEEAERSFRAFEPALRTGRRELGAGEARRVHDEFVATLRANAELLRDLYGRPSLRVLHAPAGGRGRARRFRLVNEGKPAVEVLGFADGGTEHLLERPLEVPGRWNGRSGIVDLEVSLPAGFHPEEVLGRNPITGERLASSAVQWEARDTLPAPPRRPAGPAFELATAGVTVQGGEVRFGPGRVLLAASLEIPEGYAVRFAPGLDLRMGPAVSLIVRGDLTSRGTPDRPVRVRPADPDAPWGTLAVLGSRLDPARVSLAHTAVEGGSEGETEQVAFSGAFAVHDGIVTIESSSFVGARGEDGLNLKHAVLDVVDCEVRDSASDAVDLDFCRGTMARCRITAAGGDGIDLSGSRLTLRDHRIAAVGDKGISIGERSTVTVRGVAITQAVTGIAVKDASIVEVLDSEIADAEVGVGAYVKKPAYGGASAALNGVRIESVGTRFLRDPYCEVFVDGEPLR